MASLFWYHISCDKCFTTTSVAYLNKRVLASFLHSYYVLWWSNSGASHDALYKELWHACAGPLVNVPRKGERVYYFPQGHMEQVHWLLNFSFLLLLPFLVNVYEDKLWRSFVSILTTQIYFSNDINFIFVITVSFSNLSCILCNPLCVFSNILKDVINIRYVPSRN